MLYDDSYVSGDRNSFYCTLTVMSVVIGTVSIVR